MVILRKKAGKKTNIDEKKEIKVRQNRIIEIKREIIELKKRIKEGEKEINRLKKNKKTIIVSEKVEENKK